MAEKEVQEKDIHAMKQTASFVCDVAESGDRVFEDGEIEAEEIFEELMNLAPKSTKLFYAKKAYEQRHLINEKEQRQELVEFLKQDLDLIDDGVEEVAENAVSVLDAVWELKTSIQKLRNKKKEAQA
ncbi:hypothetical protein [Bernardetia sp.]|uniref:hypothetical protein n=1 Tax=Bernardetia sp. TaxID=1937974 RepID=UPI0025BE6909|nr:hypothetical protein [Bernardetia sp.]